MVIVAQAPAAQTITSAAAATSITSQALVFSAIAGVPGGGEVLRLNAPGTNRLNGKAFKVRASGLVTLNAGTYTATVQPIVYGSASSGFTPSTSNALFEPSAIAVTQAAATAVSVPWTAELELEGDSTSGVVTGVSSGVAYNGAQQNIARAVINDTPTSVDFSTEPPLQFAAGVTLVGATAGAVVSLSEFTLSA